MDEQDNNQGNTDRNDLPEQNTTKHERTLYPKISPVKAAFIGLAGGFFLFQIFGGVLLITIFGLKLDNANINALRLLQMASQVLFILLPALIFSKMIYEDVTTVIRFRLPHWKEVALFSTGIIILTPLLNSFLLIQNYYLDIWSKNIWLFQELRKFLDQLNQMVEQSYGQLLKVNNIYDGLIVIAVVSITPAICEEIMFRGYIQKSFELRFNKFTAALITAFFFGVYHFNPFAIIPLTLLGLFFGYAAYRSNSIAVPIILHFLNNFAAVILYFIFGESELNQNMVVSIPEVRSAYYSLIYLSLLFILLIIMIRQYYKKQVTY